jgi:hypothetical protein
MYFGYKQVRISKKVVFTTILASLSASNKSTSLIKSNVTSINVVLTPKGLRQPKRLFALLDRLL